MKRIFTILFFSSCFFISLAAQQVCKRTSLFFDLNKAELSATSAKKLDSLISIIGNSEFLIELYGHADSLASNDYNFKLSAKRMDVVKEYITSKSKSSPQFREKNLGETNVPVSGSAEDNLAYNRRVDVYLIPIKNGKLIINGSRTESVETPLDYFEPCGVCNSSPVINSYYNQEEGNKANIVFETANGTPLVTAGTLKFNLSPCNENKKQDTTQLVYRICTHTLDTAMTLWEADTVKGKIAWKPSKQKLQFDSKSGCYVFSGTDSKFYNCDHPYPIKIKLPDPGARLILPKEIPYKHASITEKKRLKQNYPVGQDTIVIDSKDSLSRVTAFAKMNEHYYYVNTILDSIPSASRLVGDEMIKTYRLPAAMFTEFTFSDTLIKIKRKNSMRSDQFGFYLREYNEFIPLADTGKYAMSAKLNADYQYGFIRGKKLYVIENKNVKEKYKEKHNTIRIKFGRKDRKNFKIVKDYKVAVH
jgi:hypothetical protein